MVKTTINLDDDIYSEIVKESIEKYGSTKNISKIINMRLRNSKNNITNKKRITFKVEGNLSSLNADNEIKKVWNRSNK